MICIMNNSYHECLIKEHPPLIHSLQEMLEWVFQMTCFGDNSDLHDIKKGVCRLSKLVNKS